MAPKVLCDCCNKFLSEKIVRAHRRAANASPFLPPPMHPSRQRRIFSRSSEADSDEFNDTHAFEPSNYQDIGVDSSHGKVTDARALPASINFFVYSDFNSAPPSPTGMSLSPDAHTTGSDDALQDEFDWAPPRIRIESDSESFDGSDSDSDEEIVRAEDSDGEDSDQDPDIFDWDSFRSPDEGLAEWETLGAGYEAEAATGAYNIFQSRMSRLPSS